MRIKKLALYFVLLDGLAACSSSQASGSVRADAAAADDAMPDGGSDADSGENDAQGAGDVLDAATGDGCVPNVDSGSRICNAYTIGKGPACDECAAQCSTDECCHRGMLCSDPRYEYRVGMNACILQHCDAVCGASCENWPLTL
jgi:hypothetical protein